MPSFDILGFKFFFFSNEFVSEDKLEPVHIHVTNGSNMTKNAPKWWVGYGKCLRADDNNLTAYGLHNSDIRKIEEIIRQNSNMIINMWYSFYSGYDIEIIDELKEN